MASALALVHLWWNRFTNSQITQGHRSILTFLSPEAGHVLRFFPPASTLCIRPGERTEPFLSVIKCPRAKEGWHSCGFYLQVVTPVWYGGGVCCEHLLSHNSPGALGHSQWNDTGMLINPEITRCFFVFGSGERHTDAHAEFTVLERLTASKLHPLKHGSS